jgi:hypothetical protein
MGVTVMFIFVFVLVLFIFIILDRIEHNRDNKGQKVDIVIKDTGEIRTIKYSECDELVKNGFVEWCDKCDSYLVG